MYESDCVTCKMDFQNIYAMFAMGLLTSISHCIGMCGGFIMAYSVNIDRQNNRRSMIFPHILYHSGRIVTYAFIGAGFGLLGSTTTFALAVFNLQNLLFIFAGIVMILLGFELVGLFPVLHLAKLPLLGHYQRFIQRTLKKVNTKNIFILGLMLGFIPCGPVYIAGAVAASSGSIISGAMIMAAFGLGTFPVLLIFGFSTNILTVKFRNILLKVTAVLVIVFGGLTIYKGIQKWDKGPMHRDECCEEIAVVK